MNAPLTIRDQPVLWSAPVVEELVPAPRAWDVFCRVADLPRALFLDSASPSAALGRYSFVSADPPWWCTARGRTVSLRGPEQVALDFEADPFDELKHWLERFPVPTVPGLPPWQGGPAGLFGYDLCHHLERLPRPKIDEFEVPEMGVGLYDWVISFDHATNRAWIVSTGLPTDDPQLQLHRARERLTQVKRWLSRPIPVPKLQSGRVEPQKYHPLLNRTDLGSSYTREEFLEVIRRGIEYVHAGDCFQVNLAQRLLSEVRQAPLEYYSQLRERNPAPFAGYLDLGDFVVAGASPERFVRISRGEVETRPIKGTRPRGKTPEEDLARAKELRSSAKDRAENVMIVDLLRNDLGRVCSYGSIRVEAVCRLESYPTVHHLVSEVRGRLRPGLGGIDLLRATFPGGSVTGAPKVRAMEIIAELEPTVRGPYCGSLGYLGFDGSMDTSILIRTFTIGKGWLQFPVGGGIVADSETESEYAETLHKAEGLLRTLR